MSIMEQIKNKVDYFAKSKGIDYVDYGVTTVGNDGVYNYIVFARKDIDLSENKTNLSHIYNIYIVHENYIPEDYITDLLKILLEISGVKIKNKIEFSQYRKGNTDLSIEVAKFELSKAKKGIN